MIFFNNRIKLRQTRNLPGSRIQKNRINTVTVYLNSLHLQHLHELKPGSSKSPPRPALANKEHPSQRWRSTLRHKLFHRAGAGETEPSAKRVRVASVSPDKLSLSVALSNGKARRRPLSLHHHRVPQRPRHKPIRRAAAAAAGPHGGYQGPLRRAAGRQPRKRG